MAFNIGIGDVLAVTRLAWQLYHDCYVVARNAPDDFRELVNELASLQNVLKTLRDDVNSDKEYLDKLGEHKKALLQRCMAGSFDSLKQVEGLVVKYREIGLANSIEIWKRIKWTTHQNDVKNLRAKIMVHICNFNLFLSTMGNSTLLRLERTVVSALEQQNTATEDISETASSTITASPKPVKSPESNDPIVVVPMQRSMTGGTLVDKPPKFPAEATPPVSEDSDMLGSIPMGRQRSGMSATKSRNSDPFSGGSDSRLFPPSPRASDDSFSDVKKIRSRSTTSASTSLAENQKQPQEKSAVADAIAEAMRELSKIRKEELFTRPLRYPRRDETHQPDDKLKKMFQELAAEEAKYRRPNTRDWLRIATWWLLKARNNLELHEAANFPGSPGSLRSLSISQDTGLPFIQAYVDLLKVSWILYDIFLPSEDLASHLTDENRKLFYDCSHGLNENFLRLRNVDIPDAKTLYQQNLNIYEEMQSEEMSEDYEIPLGVDNGRWIAVDHVGAGEEHENVLFRTFVDAVIGPRNRAVRSRGCPYMLILSSQDGDSEPKVTLCNQSGSLGVTRDFILGDIVEPESSSPTGFSTHPVASELINLDFGELKVKISFSTIEDQSRFMQIPKNYFAAVKERDPRNFANATETLIFRSPVEIFEELKPDTMKPVNTGKPQQSCDLRVLETSGNEGWRLTRRLVISSSVGHKKPFSRSYFLPLSRVQIHRDGTSREVQAKWSDCTHELRRKDGRKHTDGNYNAIYTYVYDDSNPNIAMGLQFRTQVDATSFEETILKLSYSPLFEWSLGPNKNYVYDIQDSEPHPKEYKGLVLQRTRLNWKYSEFFFFYRDWDFQYTREPLSVRLPQLYYIDYISTHTEKLYKPSPENPARFSHCEKRIGTCTIDFDDESVSQALMSSLTPGHQLLYSRKITSINNKKPSSTRLWTASGWLSRGNAEIQLWKKEGNLFRLLARWSDKGDKDRWVTLSLPRTGIDMLARGSNIAALPAREYETGRKIDMANLLARDPRDKVGGKGKLEAPFTLAFETFRDREEFAELVNGPGRDSLQDVFGY